MGVIFLCLATQVHSMFENGRQGYFRRRQIGKGTCTMFDGIGHQRTASPGPYMDNGGGADLST